jgi:nicotinamidase-related amidase
MLDPKQTLLIAVDLQEKLLPAIPDRERVLKNSRLLLRLARTLEIPVVLTSQDRKGLGPVVPEILAEAPGASPLDKVAFGCFGDEPFVRALEPIPRGQLLVCGIETHICVTQTVLGARERRYEVHVASDAVGSRTAANHDVGLARMKAGGAVLSSTEMAIYELLQRSDAPAFKAMLPHLKG